MRLIDADALLDKVQDYGEGQERLMLIDPYWVRKAPTVERPHGEWILCSERLPEEDGRFLVFLPDRNGTFMCADFLSGKWYQDDYECTSNHVKAWMPLPKPYKEEGEAE